MKRLLGLFALVVVATCPPHALAALAAMSVRTATTPGGWYDVLYVFPPDFREYSDRTFHGWSLRQDWGDRAMRDVQVIRARTPGAYVMVTDLFEDGLFSKLSHTVVFALPRDPGSHQLLYEVNELPGGRLQLVGPNGSEILFDARSRAVVGARGFRLAPPGAPGTPPGFAYDGASIRLQTTGKSPFLLGTPATMTDGHGGTCALRADEIFLFGPEGESDRLRWDDDEHLFAYLRGRCRTLVLPPLRPEAAASQRRLVLLAASVEEPLPIHVPHPPPFLRSADSPEIEEPSEPAREPVWNGGVLGLVAGLFR